MIDKELLKRYVQNQYSAKDWNLLKQYFSGKDLQVLKDSMQKDWENNTQELDQKIEEVVAQKMLQNIKAEIKNRKPIVPLRRIWFIRAAAAAILFVIASIWYFSIIPTNKKIEFASNYGEIQNIVLPDSTSVVLNANSALYYWEKNPRKVWLKGEAFFDVRKKPSTKARFWVLTEDLQIEVLGTAFNVRNRYASTEVFLEEGKVDLELKESNRNNILMTPGDIVNYSIKKAILEEKKIAKTVERYAWKQGIKQLNTSGKEILAEIKVIYGLDFEVEYEAVLDQKYVIPIPLQDKETALELLEGLMKIKLESTQTPNTLRLKKGLKKQ